MPKPRRPPIAPLLGGLLLIACGSDPSAPPRPTRSYLMGFSAFPPRPDTALVLPTLTLTTQHSDAGLVQLSVPWQVLSTASPPPRRCRPYVCLWRTTTARWANRSRSRST